MAKARSVEDVVLGEAKAGDYADMVAIASVIENRAAKTGLTYEQVVQNQREFNAYNKALPAGVNRFRDLAVKAVEQVKTFGPVHNATFYATPSATKGLPPGLSFVTATKGHQFFDDPQNRAIGTAVGYVTPNAEPINVAGQPANTLYDVANPPTPEARPEPGLLASAAPTGLGLAALASPADLGRVTGQTPAPAGVFDFTPDRGKIRNMEVAPELTGMVQGAISRMGPDYGWTTTSGGQPAKGTSGRRTGSVRHDIDESGFGQAIDGSITKDGVTLDPVNNRQDYMNALTNLAEAGVGGIGHYGWGIHADVKSPNTWGPDTTSATLDPGFGAAIQQGRGLSSLGGNYPTPPSRSAPVGPVERGALADIPGMQQAQTSPRGILGDISMPTQGPTFGQDPSVTSPAQAAPAAPSVDMAALSEQYGQYRSPTPPTPEQQINAMTPAISMPSQMPSFAQVAPAAPTAVPSSVPVPTPAPRQIAPPPAPVVAPPAPVQRQAVAAPQMSQPTAPPAPSATGQDVWDGRAQSGIATNGNQMSRNPDGTVSMTSSRYGYTETMNPDGSYRSTNAPGILGIDAAMNGLFGGIGRKSDERGIQGPLGQQGIQPSSGFMGVPSAKTEMGGRVRGTVGSIAGGAIGGLLGPIGGLLGSYLGSQMAQGKNPIGGLLGPQNLQQEFQRGYTPGLAFPGRPEAPANPGSGQMTGYGEAAARGEFGEQAGRAARGEISGLF